jgi:hypothetical protein
MFATYYGQSCRGFLAKLLARSKTLQTYVVATCLSGVESVLLFRKSPLLSDLHRLKVNFFRRIEAATLSLEADAISKVVEAQRKTAIAAKTHAEVALAEAQVIKIRRRRKRKPPRR